MSIETQPLHSSQTRLSGHTVWQVKASTLCNLRCKYCYEWDRLADRRRMSLDQWRLIIEAAARYRDIRRDRHGVEQRTFFAWHGGEASLLPVDYVEDVLDLQVDILGEEPLDTGAYVNGIQTNLFRRNDTLDLMAELGFLLSVSLDYKSGARVDGAGRDAEPAIMENLEGLLREGATCGVAMVLGRHNHEHVIEIHDHLERIGASWLRFIAMYAPPSNAPGGNLQLTAQEAVDALAQLFTHRQGSGSKLPVSPLDRAVATVQGLRDQNLPPITRDRRVFGENRIVVHPDGKIAAQAGSTTPEHVLGNIFEQTMDDIIASEAYEASLQADDDKRAQHCGHCRYQRHCDLRPALEDAHAVSGQPCSTEAPLCDFINAEFDQHH